MAKDLLVVNERIILLKFFSMTLYKKFNPRQTARVYSVEYGMYQVGGGYFVDQAALVKFDR